MNLEEEKKRVEEHSAIANYGAGVMTYATSYCGEIFKRFMVRGGVLELGPAEGIMTDLLYPDFKDDYTVVDGAEFFISDLKKRYPNIKGEACLFEEYKPARKFENIILGHVMEHVEAPVEILKLCKDWLSDNGRIISAVPNSESLHRKAAVKMGLLSSTKQLNETDIKNGHRRVYDRDMFAKDFVSAGLKILKQGGYWMKPLSNSQIDKTWNDKMIRAFMELGEEYPDIAAEIYVVAGK